jgi:hypothetical protein
MVLRGWRAAGPEEVRRITKAAAPFVVSAAPRRLRSRRLRWSSLARRQSPRARAFRQGRQSFFLASKLTR